MRLHVRIKFFAARVGSQQTQEGLHFESEFFTLLQNKDPTLKESWSTQRECTPGMHYSSMKSCRFAAAAITSHATFPRMRGIFFRERDHRLANLNTTVQSRLEKQVGRRGQKAWSEGVAERRGRKAWSNNLLIFKSRENPPFAEIFFALKRTGVGLHFSEGRN